jgi:hypothetical protein
MSKRLYKVVFHNHGKVYELYARHVAASEIWGFTEIGELVFDVHGGVVVDPTEERLQAEFGNTRALHLPMQSIVRIEEVEKKGQSAIRDAESGERVVTPIFAKPGPLPAKPR